MDPCQELVQVLRERVEYIGPLLFSGDPIDLGQQRLRRAHKVQRLLLAHASIRWSTHPAGLTAGAFSPWTNPDREVVGVLQEVIGEFGNTRLLQFDSSPHEEIGPTQQSPVIQVPNSPGDRPRRPELRPDGPP
jgi:hypothetical protein